MRLFLQIAALCLLALPAAAMWFMPQTGVPAEKTPHRWVQLTGYAFPKRDDAQAAVYNGSIWIS